MTFKQFVEMICEYESDTFSAEGSQITEDEAIKVAEKYLDSVEAHIDGVGIDARLDEVRES